MDTRVIENYVDIPSITQWNEMVIDRAKKTIECSRVAVGVPMNRSVTDVQN